MNPLAQDPLTSPASPPLPEAAAEFDLELESEEEMKGERSSVGPFVVVYAGAGGFFALLGSLGLLGVLGEWGGVPGIVALAVGLLVVAAAIIGMRAIGSGMAVRLRLDDTGVAFTRRNGKIVSAKWDDPGLRINLDHLQGDPAKVLPRTDARFKRPFWVDVWTAKSRFMALETTIPEEAFSALLDRANRNGVRVSQTRVAFYWHDAPKSPGWLDFDNEGSLGADRTLNGEVNRLRGRAAPHDP